MSPCARSMAAWRKAGFYVEHCEHWDAFSKRKRDLLGFGDSLCLAPGMAVIVQSTSRANISARIRKINGLESARHWKESGGRIVVEGWDKHGTRWRVKQVEL